MRPASRFREVVDSISVEACTSTPIVAGPLDEVSKVLDSVMMQLHQLDQLK